jgi:ribosome-binding protein aMBF1 (putative translation factor)
MFKERRGSVGRKRVGPSVIGESRLTANLSDSEVAAFKTGMDDLRAGRVRSLDDIDKEQPAPVRDTPYEPHPLAAQALHTVAARVRERIMAAGLCRAELADDIERLAQIASSLASGHRMPEV